MALGLRKSERDRVETARAILKPFGIVPTVAPGGQHKMLYVGNIKIPIATSPGRSKWEADIRRAAEKISQIKVSL